MNKQEFIDRLRAALNGRISPALVAENVNFYEDYINVEIRKGKTEEEVLNALGDPRLIARTIVETNGGDGSNAYQSAEYQESGYQNTDYQNTGYQNTGYQKSDYQDTAKSFHIPGWLWAIIVILIVVLVLSAVFSLLSFLLPILIPVLLVLFFVKLFRDWLN